MVLEALVQILPAERIDDFGVAARHHPQLGFGHQVPHDAQKFVAAPADADVPSAVHAEQPSRGAEDQVSQRVPVGVVVELEAVVIHQLDAEAVAAVLLPQRHHQPLLAHLAAVEERAAITPHPAQQRFALLQFNALLAQLFEDMKKDLVPVFDFVADGQIQRFKPGTDEVQLRGAQLQHPGHVIQEIADRSRQLRLGGDDFGRQWLAAFVKRQFLGHRFSARRDQSNTGANGARGAGSGCRVQDQNQDRSTGTKNRTCTLVSGD